MDLSRRSFLQKSIAAGVGVVALPYVPAFATPIREAMKFGLVTYEWGKDWDLPR